MVTTMLNHMGKLRCVCGLVRIFIIFSTLALLSCSDENELLQGEFLPIDQAYATGLPVLVIDTPEGVPVTSKTVWVENASLVVQEANRTTEQSYSTSIRGRGNVTWSHYPKKPYYLKLNKKASLLGMKPAKKWILLANWDDRTLLRNDVAFEIARRTSLLWTPHGTPVELILNGNYCGSYYLCEKIQIHENRLPITEMSATDEDSLSITGGYLLEIDRYYDEVNKFRSSIYRLPYQFRSPDEKILTKAQFAYIKNYVNQLETSLSDKSRLRKGDYNNWIDAQSFVDWWIVNELCYNREVSRPKSVYLFKQRGELLRMGPVWDFDFSTFGSREDVYVAERFPYLARLFKNKDFQALARHRWAELRPLMTSIPDYIDQRAELIRASNEQNIRMWPISVTLNGDEKMTFDEAIDRMKQSIWRRIAVIDKFLYSFD